MPSRSTPSKRAGRTGKATTGGTAASPWGRATTRFRPPAVSGRWRAFLVSLPLAAACVVLLRTAWVTDDAFITLRTIDNFVHGHGLRWNPAERVQAFTHPLWLFVLTLPYVFTREAFYTTVVVSLVTALAGFGILAWRLRATPGVVFLGVGILLLSRAFVDFSTSGLENPLTHLLLVLFVLSWRREPIDSRRFLRFALLAGLLATNRLDALLLVLPALVWAVRRDRPARRVRSLALGFLPFLLWEGFALFYYGLLVPNTALAKLGSGVPAAELARQGLRYFANSLRLDPLTLPFTVGVAAVAAVRGGARERALALGIALYLLYVLRIGGDFMSGRFLAAPFALAVLLLLRWESPPSSLRPVAAGVALLLALLTPRPSVLSGADFGFSLDGVVDRAGIADERRFYFSAAGLFNGLGHGERPAPPVTALGRTLRRAKVPVMVEGAVGVVGYTAGPSVHFVDPHALADPLLARLPMVDRDPLYDTFQQNRNGRPAEQPWRIGHFLRAVPSGYLETLLSGENRLRDPGAARLYERVRIVTRGPLLDAERWGEIVRWNLPGGGLGSARERPPYDPVPWDEAIAARPDVGEYRFRRALEAVPDARLDEARQDLVEAIRLDPRRGAAWALLAEVERSAGRLQAAREALLQGMKEDPEEVALPLTLGDVELERGEFEAALQAYRQAAELDPHRGEAYGAVGTTLLQLGRFEEAVFWLQTDRRMHPDRPEPYDRLGLAHLNRNRTAEAVALFRAALDRRADFEPAWSHLGIALAQLGDKAGAIQALERALALNDRNPESCYQLAVLLRERGDHERAVELLQRAAALGLVPARRALGEPPLAPR